MYVQVKLLNGFQQSLWYHIIPATPCSVRLGNIVQVPLRTQIVTGVIISYSEKAPNVPFSIKEIHALAPFPTDPHYHSFVTKLAAYHVVPETHFLQRIAHFLSKKQKQETSPQHTPYCYDSSHTPSITLAQITLTTEQLQITSFLKPFIAAPSYTPTVLHGVTASGKTEVYKELMLHALAQHKTTILLLPEVMLAQSFERRLRIELGEHIPIHGFHSASTAREKQLVWQKLLRQEPIIIVGVHLPILLPIAQLGLIIVDEEHETGYQEKKHPKINTRDAAILRAHCTAIPILLGSATPSLPTLYNIEKNGWHFFQLKTRFRGTFPSVQVLSLIDKKTRKNFWITQELHNAIQDRLSKKEQVLIFLNRRGYSFFVQCKTCSFIITCATCSVSLTLHEHNKLTCHYCGHTTQQPLQCLSCKKDTFLKKGIGTQQVVSILQQLFPAARISRADMDTTTKKKEWQQTLESFMHNKIDILVGTQTITKGYDFPNVTLVGILWADLHLNIPLYNAAETTLQQLIQVAGRAGRTSNNSLVIVQTLSDHTIFDYIHEINYPHFYVQEIEKRRALNYPPCQRLAEIEVKSPDEHTVDRESCDLVHELSIIQNKHNYHAQILGPSKPPVHKIQNMHIRKIYIKSPDIQHIIALFTAINKKQFSSMLYFAPNPVT